MFKVWLNDLTMQLAGKPAETQSKEPHHSVEMHYNCDGSFIVFLPLPEQAIIHW